LRAQPRQFLFALLQRLLALFQELALAVAPLTPNSFAQRPTLVLAPWAGALAQRPLTVPLTTGGARLPQQPVEPLGLATFQRIKRPQVVGVWGGAMPFRQPALEQADLVCDLILKRLDFNRHACAP